MKRQHVEAWLQSGMPGEVLQAYAVGGPNNGATLDASDSPGSRHPADLQVQVGSRGLDPQRRLGLLTNLCVVVTRERLAVASVGGLIGVRPKELLASAPRGEFRCEWWINDVSDAPASAYCNLVIRFRDGSWAGLGVATKLLGRVVKSGDLARDVIAALGPDAGEIDWRTPPSG